MVNIPSVHFLHIEDLQNPTHPSVFEEYESYNLLIIRLPERIVPNPTVDSFGFILNDNSVWTLDKKTNKFILLQGGMEQLHKFLDEKIDILIKDMESVTDQITQLEDSLYQSKSINFMFEWNNLIKDISKAQRILSRSVNICDSFIAKSRDKPNFPINEFQDLYEHLERILRFVFSANEQLHTIYQYYSLQANDRLNRIIYLLTIISVIFLPLNLIVGFFGMNTGGMPLTGIKDGTVLAVTIMVGTTILFMGFVVWYIKKVIFRGFNSNQNS